MRQRMLKRGLVAVSAGLLACGVLAACGSSGSDDKSASGGGLMTLRYEHSDVFLS